MPLQEIETEQVTEVLTTNPSIQIQEKSSQKDGKYLVEMTVASEMKGGYPNIKLPDDIQVEEIQKQGRNFVTLPIGQVDARSRNGRNYRRKAEEMFVEQVNQKRPEGGWGHIKDEDMGTSYGPPAIRWLAAMIDKKGTVWGKGLPLTADAQQYFEDARLTNARVGTSRHAWVTMEGDDVVELDLIKLDLADPARVGIPMTAAKPELSTEMHDESASGQKPDESGASVPAAAIREGEAVSSPSVSTVQTEQESTTVTDANTTRVTELELERRDLKAEIAKFETENNRLKRVAEDAADVRELWGIDPNADFVKAAREFKNQNEEMAKEASELLMDAANALVAEKVKVESVRPLVMELVRAEKPVTRKALTRVIDEVLARESIQKVLTAQVTEQMGSAQPAPVTTTPGAPAKSFLKPKPEVA